MMTASEIVTTYRSEILAVAAKHGARNVRLFGSVARGADDERSDIDLVVDFDPERSLLPRRTLSGVAGATRTQGGRRERPRAEAAHPGARADGSSAALRDPGERLRDILDAISQIERHAARGQEVFEQDELIQVWIFHHIQIIGEAASQLGREFHEDHPGIPWPEIVALRNLLIHEYFGVDLHEVWRTVEHDLPLLRLAIQKVIDELSETQR
jgi:uncharacterized protein with HEPN domain